MHSPVKICKSCLTLWLMELLHVHSTCSRGRVASLCWRWPKRVRTWELFPVCQWLPLQEHRLFQQDQVLFVDGLGSTKVQVLPDHRAAKYCGKKLKEEKIMRLGCLKSGLLSEAL